MKGIGVKLVAAVLIALAACTAVTDRTASRAGMCDPEAAPIASRFRDARIPAIQVSEASLQEVLALLTAESKRLDPEGRGIRFVVQREAGFTPLVTQRLKVQLHDVPLARAIPMIVKTAGYDYRVEGDIVVLKRESLDP